MLRAVMPMAISTVENGKTTRDAVLSDSFGLLIIYVDEWDYNKTSGSGVYNRGTLEDIAASSQATPGTILANENAPDIPLKAKR